MPSVTEIIQSIFGGSIDINSILTLAVSTYAVIASIVQWRSKVKLIKADRTLTSAEQKIDAQRVELAEVKNAISIMGSMLCSAYLANVNVDEKTKRAIANGATALNKIASINLTAEATKLVDTINTYIPGTNIQAEKENILAEAKAVEEILDTTTENVNNIVDKLDI